MSGLGIFYRCVRRHNEKLNKTKIFTSVGMTLDLKTSFQTCFKSDKERHEKFSSSSSLETLLLKIGTCLPACLPTYQRHSWQFVKWHFIAIAVSISISLTVYLTPFHISKLCKLNLRAKDMILQIRCRYFRDNCFYEIETGFWFKNKI